MNFNYKLFQPIILLIFVFDVIILQGKSNETKSILILCGLSPAQPAYQPILDGIRQRLNQELFDNYDLHLEYLESENYKIDDYPREKFNVYNEKYRETKIDLLIIVGRNAIDLIRKNAESYLFNIPAISVDFDFSNFGYKTDLRLNDKTASLGMKLNIDKMISTALKVFPSTSSIYFIGGTTPFDRFMMNLAKETVNKDNYKQEFTFITDLTMDEILHKVNKLPQGSLIFVPSFNTDIKRVTYYNPEAIRLISRTANSPVFAYSDMGFGDGSFGGYILSFRKIGLLTGQTALKILNGENPSSFHFSEDDYYELVFDWRELKHWKLENSNLIPEGSNILFEEKNPIEKYKWIIGSALLFLVLQSLLIANLIRMNRNQKILTKKIIETENKYREFLHEDRSLRLGQIAASLSHELNQPLTAILSTAQAGINFINSNEANPDLLKQILQKIVENDKRTASILSSIRGMLKIENREKRKIDLNNCVSELINVFQSEANNQNIKVNVQLIDTPVFIFADKIQIQQVLLNLILNAAQVMKKQSTELHMIDIIQSVKDGNVIISVRDYGEGIDQSIKDRIFKPFVTSRVDGSGIGLAICKTIIEDHDGKIWAENMPGGGAKLSFSLKIISNEQI